MYKITVLAEHENWIKFFLHKWTFSYLISILISIFPETIQGGETKQSSDYHDGRNTFVAKYGNDHNRGTFQCTSFQDSPWWWVDLGKTYLVKSITVYMRSNCCGKYLLFRMLFKHPFDLESMNALWIVSRDQFQCRCYIAILSLCKFPRGKTGLILFFPVYSQLVYSHFVYSKEKYYSHQVYSDKIRIFSLSNNIKYIFFLHLMNIQYMDFKRFEKLLIFVENQHVWRILDFIQSSFYALIESLILE